MDGGGLIGVDIRGWESDVRRYITEFGMDTQKIVEERARSLVKRLLELTPPVKGKSITAAEKGPSAQKTGRASIQRDLRRAVTPLQADTMKLLTGGEIGSDSTSVSRAISKHGSFLQASHERNRLISRLKAVIAKKDTTALKAIFKHLGRWKEVEFVAFNPALHTSVRNAHGKVPGWQRKVTLDTKAWAEYQTDLCKRIGYAKSGWNRAARALGVSIPKWVARHGLGGGTIENRLGDPVSPYIRMINNASKIPDGDIRPIIVSAIQIERNAMARELDWLAKDAARKSGFSVH